MSSQKALIDKYILVLLEYIHLIDTSEIIRGLDNSTTVFQIGLHAIAHIYKLTYYITKNVETAGCYTQKGIYCYLEYIEQMNRTNSLHNLNNMDAVLFVYDKTLAEIYTPTGKRTNTSNEQNMFTNIVSLNHPETREHNWKVILENLSNITQTVLWIDNLEITYLERLNITHEYLPKFMNIYAELPDSSTLDILSVEEKSSLNNQVGVSGRQPDTTFAVTKAQANPRKPTLLRSSGVLTIKYISLIQDKLRFTRPEYVDFLDVFYKTYKKIAKHLTATTSTADDKCLCITVNLAGKTMSEVLSSEYGKQEGWKTTSDFIKWLFI